MNWFDRFLGETRARMIGLLRRSSRSINDLADALGISDNAVRTHVAAMQRDGVVELAGVERSGVGKPAQLYRITADAEEMFPKAYALVLNGVLDALVEREGRESVRALLREVGERAAAGRARGGGSVEDDASAAADVLRALGGDVETEPCAGGCTIRGYGCPLSAVVDRHDDACALAESLVAAVSGRPVRERCDRGERPRCAFFVEGDTGSRPPAA